MKTIIATFAVLACLVGCASSDPSEENEDNVSHSEEAVTSCGTSYTRCGAGTDAGACCTGLICRATNNCSGYHCLKYCLN